MPNIAVHWTVVDRYRHFLVKTALAPNSNCQPATARMLLRDLKPVTVRPHSSSLLEFRQHKMNLIITSVRSWFNRERLATGRSHLTRQCTCLALDSANKEISLYVQMSNYMCRNHRWDMTSDILQPM